MPVITKSFKGCWRISPEVRAIALCHFDSILLRLPALFRVNDNDLAFMDFRPYPERYPNMSIEIVKSNEDVRL